MRVEDIDGPRVVPGSAEGILLDLKWLGLDWDEGPDVGGPFAPYIQSERTPLYEQAFAELHKSAYVYPCSCTRKDLRELASAPHTGAAGGWYPGTCRDGPQHPDRPLSYRFAMPAPAGLQVEGASGGALDGGALNGRARDRSAETVSDFVVRRADGVWSYHFATAFDDAAMGITEVVRADDLVDAAHPQAAVAFALGMKPPSYLHIPLLHGASGVRLSKRTGSTSIAQLRAQGVAAERVVGLLASTFHLAKAGQACHVNALVERFEVECAMHADTAVDPDAIL